MQVEFYFLGPINYGWESCCWVDLTADDGTSIEGGAMIQKANIYDFDNTSPDLKLPPLWLRCLLYY